MKYLSNKDFRRRCLFSRRELPAHVVRSIARNPVFFNLFPRLSFLLSKFGSCRTLPKNRCFFSYGGKAFNNFFRSNRFFAKRSILLGFFGTIRKTGF